MAKTTSDKMPALFIGHGSPMNALADNVYSRTLNQLGRDLPRPRALLVISAHWLTAGSFVTHMSNPRTIHDFYGFPEELFAVKYPAPGSPEVAELVGYEVDRPRIQLDENAWGLDHGTWSVLKHLYPNADIPVVQMSIDMAEPPQFHLELGRKLAKLRTQGVMIVGSGNIVHNLRQIRWPQGPAGSGKDDSAPYDWAVDFDARVKAQILNGDFKPLTAELLTSAAGRMSVPTPDHYYPLLYALGASEAGEEPKFFYEGLEMGSISMRSVIYGV